MFICLKCRTFYSEDSARFCLKDGLPLARVDQTSDLWHEGAEAVRKTRSVLKRQLRLQKLKRVISVSITTTLVIMVVSVMALNSYVYLNPAIEMPLPSSPSAALLPPQASETPDVEESPTPAPSEETPSRTPDKASVPESPKPISSPVIAFDSHPSGTPMPTPRLVETPQPTPQTTPTPVPEISPTPKKKRRWDITVDFVFPPKPSTPKRTPTPSETPYNPNRQEKKRPSR
jgi:hypothetical protein